VDLGPIPGGLEATQQRCARRTRALECGSASRAGPAGAEAGGVVSGGEIT
jgi:hypothetical protein